MFSNLNDLYIANAIRLINGTNEREGRVEILWRHHSYYHYYRWSSWSTICDNQWSDNDAIVVCKQLGYSGGFARGGAYFGQGTELILIDDVNCTGHEINLFSCDNSYTANSCGHGEDVGVVCTGEIFHGIYCLCVVITC